MKKSVFRLGSLILMASSLTLAGCNTEDTTEKEDTQQTVKANKQEEKSGAVSETKKNVDAEKVNWKKEIKEISKSGDVESDKYNALEMFLVTYEATEDETKQFAKDIVKDYKSGKYLEGTDYEKLVKIFKSYVVQKNANGSVKEFAFDYFQNQKYVYRGVDQPDSSAVQSNERQMNKALKNIK